MTADHVGMTARGSVGAVLACPNQNRSMQFPPAGYDGPLRLNLPGFAPVAAVLPADLHGRPVADATSPRFEAAELLNLHDVREAARRNRSA